MARGAVGAALRPRGGGASLRGEERLVRRVVVARGRCGGGAVSWGATFRSFRFGKSRMRSETRRPVLRTEKFLCSAFSARLLLIFAVRSMWR